MPGFDADQIARRRLERGVGCLLALGLLPVLIYPYCVVANLMAWRPGPLDVALWGYLWLSTLYPILYFACAFVAWALLRWDCLQGALLVSGIPVVLAGLIATLYLTC
jgi:hypothetical protein